MEKIVRFREVQPSVVTDNSLGQPIHNAPEGIKNFWHWFGNSKIKDDQGRPIVSYHGGKFNEKIHEPDTVGKPRKAYQLSFGMHFTPVQSEAEPYVPNKKGYLTVAYLKMLNPLDLTSRDILPKELYDKFPPNLQKKYNKFYKKHFTDFCPYGYLGCLETLLDSIKPAEAKAFIESLGYDGVIYTARANMLSYYRPFKAFIVFNPNQIKSINNNGQFSNGNNITTENT